MRFAKLAVLSCTLPSLVSLRAQEAGTGISMPLTITGGAMYTHRADAIDPSTAPMTAAFRAMLYPTFQLGSHWIASASIQVSSSPFFYFQSDETKREVRARLIQGYVGYTISVARGFLTVKSGQMVSAFGSFPLRYDDDVNPLIDVPMTYGSSDYGKPLQYPVTLYGQPGVELDLNLHRFDGRVQFVNSSPALTRVLFAGGQNANWATGAGYTIRQGFRVGASYYRGGYLPTGVLLHPTERAGDWPGTGVGVDVQWAAGYWSVNGEWQRFFFPYPHIIADTSMKFGYVEAKRTLHPRLYLAGRIGYNANESFPRPQAPVAFFRPDRQSYELVGGLRVNRFQLLKIGYEWVHKERSPGTRDNVFGMQFVTSIEPLSRAFHRAVR